MDRNLKIRNDLDIVAVLYDIENSSYETLTYALSKAQKISTNIKVVSDWEKCPNQQKWNQLLVRKGLSFLQIERKSIGKNSLDNALFEAAVALQKEGVQQFIIITTDTDFADIAKFLRMSHQVYILGIGGICCNDKLRVAYDDFLYYPPGMAGKVAHDDDIPPGEPIEAVRERLLKAYSLAKGGKGWKTLHSVANTFKILYPDFIFPEDHPSKFRRIIKIYHTSFEWKRNGKQILVQRRRITLVY